VATRYRRLRVYRWLEEEEETIASPMARMKPPIVAEQPIPTVPEDGMRRAAVGLRRQGLRGPPDTAVVLFLLDTGARRGELADLQFGDLDLDLDVPIVLGKGRRERALPYGRKTAVALDRYRRARARHKDAYLPWLWLGKHGRLTAWGVQQLVRRRGEEAVAGAPSAPASPRLRPRLAGPKWRRDGSDAAGDWKSRQMLAATPPPPPAPRSAPSSFPGRPFLGRSCPPHSAFRIRRRADLLAVDSIAPDVTITTAANGDSRTSMRSTGIRDGKGGAVQAPPFRQSDAKGLS